MAALPTMLAEDRKRAGWSVEQAARRLGVSSAIFREIEDGDRSPNWETFDRICKLYGWPQMFIGYSGASAKMSNHGAVRILAARGADGRRARDRRGGEVPWRLAAPRGFPRGLMGGFLGGVIGSTHVDPRTIDEDHPLRNG